jgi:hypothetical protein
MRKMPKTKRITVKSVLRKEVERLTPMNPMIRRLDSLLSPQLRRRRSTIQFLPEVSETDSPLNYLDLYINTHDYFKFEQ